MRYNAGWNVLSYFALLQVTVLLRQHNTLDQHTNASSIYCNQVQARPTGKRIAGRQPCLVNSSVRNMTGRMSESINNTNFVLHCTQSGARMRLLN